MPPAPINPSTLTDPEFIEWSYRQVLMRDADAAGTQHYLAALATGLSRLDLVGELYASSERQDRLAACRLFPPGHPLSPLPSGGDIAAHRAFDWNPPAIAGIDLRLDEQWQLLERLARHYDRLPFVPWPTAGRRYHYENDSYSYADAIILGCLMLELRPRRVIEVGSGYSSAAMLDVNELCLMGQVDITFIDPDPSRLAARLATRDARVRVLASPVQAVSSDVFGALEARDIVFIDSSHVSKLGSDVNWLLFEILPSLRPGVFIHVHDVLYPFEYPQAWLERGWVWNEQYILRAFLQFNEHFAIRVFSSLLIAKRPEWFAARMPGCLKNPGGCLWIEKVR